jgi:hypothetical protein
MVRVIPADLHETFPVSCFVLELTVNTFYHVYLPVHDEGRLGSHCTKLLLPNVDPFAKLARGNA